MFTGVSGSGKSSLVFGTIAAESQRLINRPTAPSCRASCRRWRGRRSTARRPRSSSTRSAWVPTPLHRRHGHRRQRDAAHPLQPPREAAHRPPSAFAFNVASVTATGGITVQRGDKTQTKKATYSRTGGMCERCEGRGSLSDFDLSALYDDSKSINEGAITIPGYSMDGWYGRIFRGCGFFDCDKPIRKFNKRERNDLLYKEPTKIKVEGINLTYSGLIPTIQKSFLQGPRRDAAGRPRFVERAVTFTIAPSATAPGSARPLGPPRSRRSASPTPARCRSTTRPNGCAVWTNRPSRRCSRRCGTRRLVRRDRAGLPRSSARPGRSRGEAQRAKMIRHLGSSLTDVTYVFDEPTIGMHPHDVQRMNDLLLQLRDKGNTVLVVEHEPETIAIADHVVDLGPGAGTAGGEVVFEGTVKGLRSSETITGRHLDDRAALKATVRTPTDTLEIRGAEAHNLQDVDVDMPSACWSS